MGQIGNHFLEKLKKIGQDFLENFSGKSALLPGRSAHFLGGCSKNKRYIHPSGKSALLPGQFSFLEQPSGFQCTFLVSPGPVHKQYAVRFLVTWHARLTLPEIKPPRELRQVFALPHNVGTSKGKAARFMCILKCSHVVRGFQKLCPELQIN